MKRLIMATMILVLTFSLAACGCQATEPMPETTVPTTQTTTAPSTQIPTSMPSTIETNIPDPSVDTSMPDLLDPSVTGTTE